MADNKIYITARELSDMLGVSMGYAYKIIRKLNKELDKDGFIVIAGKVPKGYFPCDGLVTMQRRLDL
jgi:sugar-specific transcriptional regulator TrmB